MYIHYHKMYGPILRACLNLHFKKAIHIYLQVNFSDLEKAGYLGTVFSVFLVEGSIFIYEFLTFKANNSNFESLK